MQLSHSKMLVRVDASVDGGTQLVDSMLALAREFGRRGGQVVALTGDLPGILRRKLEQKFHRIHRLDCPAGSHQDAATTLKIMERERPDWLAIGGPVFDVQYVHAVSRPGTQVVLTDGVQRSAAVNLLVDGAVVPNGTTGHPNTEGSMCLVDPAFTLIDAANGSRPLDRKIVAQARRILVWNQGSDVDNWSLRTLQVLSDINTKRLSVDCIVSRDYLHSAELESFKRHSQVSLRIHRNIDRVESLAERADLAIANGHSGCYRLAYLGVPMVLVTTPESNTHIVESLHRQRAAVSVAQKTESAVNRSSDLVNVVKRLLGDRFRRHSMSRHAMGLVDGLGPQRVVDQIVQSMNGMPPARAA